MTDRLFDVGDMQPVSPASQPVLAINPAHTKNGQRVLDLARLGYLPEPVLDPTYGHGWMWSHYQPAVSVNGDMDPAKASDVQLDFTALPFRDNAFASSLFDPPYKYHAHYEASDADLRERYGLVQFFTRDDLDAYIVAGVRECLRVTTKYVIVKCQDQVTGSRLRLQTHMIAAEGRVVDMLHLSNYSTGIEQQGRTQRHVRRNYSTFVVLRP